MKIPLIQLNLVFKNLAYTNNKIKITYILVDGMVIYQ